MTLTPHLAALLLIIPAFRMASAPLCEASLSYHISYGFSLCRERSYFCQIAVLSRMCYATQCPRVARSERWNVPTPGVARPRSDPSIIPTRTEMRAVVTTA